MRTYKRSIFNMLGTLVVVVVLGIVATIFGNHYLSLPISILIGVIVSVVAYWIFVPGDNIHFELDDDGTFRYFVKGKLKNTFKLSEYKLGYYCKSGDNNELLLKLLDADGEETVIDATPLGTARFQFMFREMGEYAIQEIETITTKKK